jgi:multidrug resistance protein, MATE family
VLINSPLSFGPTALAAQSVLLITASVAFQTPYSLGMAATVRVGNLLGLGSAHKAKVASETAIGMSFMIASIMM